LRKLLWPCKCHPMLLTFGVPPAVLALWWEAAIIRRLDFPMPKIFALLEAASHASDCGVAAALLVVARSLCCDSSTSLGSESMNVSAQEKERKKEREMLRNNNQPVETAMAVVVLMETAQHVLNLLPFNKDEQCLQQTGNRINMSKY